MERGARSSFGRRRYRTSTTTLRLAKVAAHLRRLEREGLGRMPVRTHAGNARAAGEVTIGKAQPRAAETALGGLFEAETRLERHPPKRRAPRLAAHAQRSGRQPYRAHGSGAAELDGADHRAVAVNAARAARAVEAVEREKLAGDEAPRRLRAEHFRPRRDGRQQRHDHNCEPRNHIPSPVTAAAATVTAR